MAPDLPSLSPRCPRCDTTIDVSQGIPLTEVATHRFDAALSPRMGVCTSCFTPFVLEDKRVRVAEIEELSMLIISRPEAGDALLATFRSVLPPKRVVAFEGLVAEIRGGPRTSYLLLA